MLLRKTLLSLSESNSIYRFIVGHDFSRKLASRFIAGETLEEAARVVVDLNAKNFMATFDYLGENVSRMEDAAAAVRIYLNILEMIKKSSIRANISLKLTELGLDLDESFCLSNLETILKKAFLQNGFIRIDMEGSAYTDRTLTLFKRLYATYKNVGVVIQSYLYRSEKDIDDLISLGARVRLCKGAYNEPPAVAFPRKSKVDKNFILLMKKLLKDGNYPAIATHDPKMIRATKKFAKKENIDSSRFEFQMLYGIRRDLQDSLVKEGYRVRIYVPYGRQWYRYFMRRLAERPANLFFFLSNLFK